MLIVTLMSIFVTSIMFLLGGVNIPAYPAEVASAFDFLGGIIVNGGRFLAYWLSYPILAFSVTTIVLVLTVDFMYHAGFWVLTKIPFVNIRRN